MRKAALILFLWLCTGFLAALTFSRNSIYENPVTLWRSTVARTPDKVRPRLALIRALLIMETLTRNSRFYWEALGELRAVQQLPDYETEDQGVVYEQLGLANYNLGRVDDAISVWKEGLKLFPSNAVLESSIAFALEEKGNYDDALGYALDAKKHAPTLPTVANTLGLIYLAKGEYLKAAEQFLKFQDLRPEESSGYWNAALAFERAGQYHKAYELTLLYLSRETDSDHRAMAETFLKNMTDMKIR